MSTAPTRSTPRISAHTPASSSSVTDDTGTYSSSNANRDASGAGNAPRSTFPFAFNGNDTNSTNTAGTMYSGNRSRTTPRNPTTDNTAS
ncbi:hypothetical protein, partial [Dactylosporangium darangshiense]|uniref:hypothetical protein n=1 Tax=Dactylosporangium darangshiense TaxID=579108 RepID=UPI0031F13FBA